MNTHLKQYVSAVNSLLAEGSSPKELLARVREVMDRKGHSRLYPALLRAVARTFPARIRSSQPTIFLARSEDKEKYAALLKNYEEAKVKIDHSLVGGYVLTQDFIRTDDSFKSKLLTWYRKATTQD